MQSQWAAQLNPVLASPGTAPLILTNQALASGTNTVNHLLGRKLQGWRIIRKRAAADIYDNQDNNQMPDKTLILISSAAVVVDLEVF